METFSRFMYEFLTQFFSGFLIIIRSIGEGVGKIFDINSYKEIINFYKDDLSMPEWILTALALFMVFLLFFIAGLIIILFIKKRVKFRKKAVNQGEMIEEIAALNDRVSSLVKEKEEILAMKVSQLGLKPDESNIEEPSTGEEEEINTGETRFLKLTDVDEEFKNYKTKNYGNSFTLPELCENFRNFAASKL